MSLTLAQINDVCLHGDSSKECRYLAEDDAGKFYCIKKTSRRLEIDKEVDEFKKKQKAIGTDPYSLGIPIGDNCVGYTFFRHKSQGYDVKP